MRGPVLSLYCLPSQVWAMPTAWVAPQQQPPATPHTQNTSSARCPTTFVLQVYSSGKGVDINIDCHRAGGLCLVWMGGRQAVWKVSIVTCLGRLCAYPAQQATPASLLLSAAVHNNLFTDIDLGLGTRPFQSGGAKDRGAQSGAPAGCGGCGGRSSVCFQLPACLQLGPGRL